MEDKGGAKPAKDCPGIFDNVGVFESFESMKFSNSVRLQFAKFSHGFQSSDFDKFIKAHVGEQNIISLGRLSFPNQWELSLSSNDVRESLIRLGRTRINGRSCWITPLSSSEIRGFVHWLPSEIPEEAVVNFLKYFGEVLFVEIQQLKKTSLKVNSNSRYFGLYLRPGTSVDDLPHFIKVNEHVGLITIKGRKPVCFHCREVGHSKKDCKKFREVLDEYCTRPRKPDGKRKRGRRHPKSKKFTDDIDTPCDAEAISAQNSIDEYPGKSKTAIRNMKRRKRVSLKLMKLRELLEGPLLEDPSACNEVCVDELSESKIMSTVNDKAEGQELNVTEGNSVLVGNVVEGAECNEMGNIEIPSKSDVARKEVGDESWVILEEYAVEKKTVVGNRNQVSNETEADTSFKSPETEGKATLEKTFSCNQAHNLDVNQCLASYAIEKTSVVQVDDLNDALCELKMKADVN